MHDFHFRLLLDYLGLSWPGYVKVRKGVKKRLVRHMQHLECPDMGAYLDLLDHNPAIRNETDHIMAVSISRFFRDRQLWSSLERKLIPELLIRHNRSLRIWSAGCACGEEVYTIRIICERLKKTVKPTPSFDIIATDLVPRYIKKAKTGIYTASSLKEVSAEDKEQFFERKTGKNHYRVIQELKENIRWRTHNLSERPPGDNFHVIFLRNNILTYQKEPNKTKCFNQVNDALKPRGLLVIGSHEKLPRDDLNLSPVEGFSCVFRKN